MHEKNLRAIESWNFLQLQAETIGWKALEARHEHTAEWITSGTTERCHPKRRKELNCLIIGILYWAFKVPQEIDDKCLFEWDYAAFFLLIYVVKAILLKSIVYQKELY